MLCATLAISLVNALVPKAMAQRAFEGVIVSKNITTDERGTPQQFTMTMHVKSDMVKIQNSPMGTSPGSTLIYRGDKKLVWMLNEEDSSYFEISQQEKSAEVYSSSSLQGKPPVVRLTGRKSDILGYKCDQILVRGDNIETEIWATKSLGNLFATISKVLAGEVSASGAGWESTILKMGYYPIKASTKVEGKVLESQEVTKIEKNALTRDVFELPAGYKKQSNVDFMK